MNTLGHFSTSAPRKLPNYPGDRLVSYGHQTFATRFLVYWPVVCSPLVLGGARPWLWGLIGAVFLVGFAFYGNTPKAIGSIKAMDPGQEARPAPRVRGQGAEVRGLGPINHYPSFTIDYPSLLTSRLPAVIITYLFLQTIPLPLLLIAILSPQRAEWLHRAMEATGVPIRFASLSYEPLETFMAGLWLLVLALFALVLHRSLREGRIKLDKLLPALFVVATLEALYGLLQVMVPWTGLGFMPGLATGTFANHDHYAAFLGMIWPLMLTWTWGLSGRKAAVQTLHEQERNRKAREKQLFFIFLTGIVLLGLVFSESRGGIAGLAIGMSVLACLSGKNSRSLLWLVLAIWMIILAYGSIIGFQDIIERFSRVQHDAPGRFEIWGFSWRLIRDHWLTGIGAGAYPSVILLYQTHYTDQLQVFAAHSDYLEITAEWGLPFALLIFSLVWGYWWKTVIGTARKSSPDKKPLDPQEKLIRIGALAGSAAFLCHIWIEFAWQIPANQVYFVILLVLMGYRRGAPRSAAIAEGR